MRRNILGKIRAGQCLLDGSRESKEAGQQQHLQINEIDLLIHHSLDELPQKVCAYACDTYSYTYPSELRWRFHGFTGPEIDRFIHFI